MKEIKNKVPKLHGGNEIDANKKQINNADSKSYCPSSFLKVIDVGFLDSVTFEGTCTRKI